MRTQIVLHHKYLTTLGKQLIFSLFVLFIFQLPSAIGQGAYKIGVGLHTSDYNLNNSDELSLANKVINYHATLGYRLEIPLIFAEAAIGLDVDRYELDRRNVEEFKVILPITAGLKLFMFDIKTGVMGRVALNKNAIKDQVTERKMLTFQYLTGVNVRFEKISIGLDYLSSQSYLMEKVLKKELTIDNQIRNRIFLTLYYKF